MTTINQIVVKVKKIPVRLGHTVLNLACVFPFAILLTIYDLLGGKIAKDSTSFIFFYGDYPLGRITYNQVFSYAIQLKYMVRFVYLTVKYKFFTKPEKYDEEE